jgi:hypothetical protein
MKAPGVTAPTGGTPFIAPGTPTIGTLAGVTYNATPRTILTYVAGGGVQHFTGFTAFPDLRAYSVTLLRLEPGSRTTVAEILFINLDPQAQAVGGFRYAYMMEGSLGNDGRGVFAYFVHSDSLDGEPERLYITNTNAAAILDENISRFYVLERSGANWSATRIVQSTPTSVGSNPLAVPPIEREQNLVVGVLENITGTHFNLRPLPGTGVGDQWLQASATMRVYTPHWEGLDVTRHITELGPPELGRLYVVITDNDIAASNMPRAMVAFSFDIGILDTAPHVVTGITPPTAP